MSESTGAAELDVSHIAFGDQLKVQAGVLAPILQAMREELGKDKADELMARGLEPYARQTAAMIMAMGTGSPMVNLKALIDKIAVDSAGEIEYEIHEANEQRLSFDVTDCVLARFYRALGMSDIGHRVACSLDYQALEYMDPDGDIVLDRPQTLMQGGTRCEFRIHKKAPAGE